MAAVRAAIAVISSFLLSLTSELYDYKWITATTSTKVATTAATATMYATHFKELTGLIISFKHLLYIN